MKKKIDSALCFFQYLIARIIVIGTMGFLIYSIIMQEIGAIIFCSLFLIFSVYILKKQFPKPTDLSFDQNYLYLDNLPDPIKITDIESLENGVVKYKSNGRRIKLAYRIFTISTQITKNLKRL